MVDSKVIRTRFAPSPTGFLHIGGARTAFWAYLLARKNGGKFILRVEDTDQERLVEGAIAGLIKELNWFGIEIDEGPTFAELKAVGENVEGIKELTGSYGPYIQSLRLKRYQEVVNSLIETGAAYRCNCTSEMLEQERLDQMARRESPGYSGYCRDRNVSAEDKHVVRFRMPFKAKVVLEDAVKGTVTWEDPPLRDPVILKSDGFPTYHLAVVVDDHDMEITHVLRGDEWLSSAPLHLLIYQALGWQPPTFAHLPVILGPNGKKLSKREGDVFTSSFREAGYLPQALLNFTVLIGWSAGEGLDQEIFSREELIQKFSLDRINAASGKFDYEKLAWMNGLYIRAMKAEDFILEAKSRIEAAGLSYDHEKFSILAGLVQERVKIFTEIVPMIEFLFKEQIERDLEALIPKGFDKAQARDLLLKISEVLTSIDEFVPANIEGALKKLAEDLKFKVGVVLVATRIAATGKKNTPPLFESLQALGQKVSVQRVQQAIECLID